MATNKVVFGNSTVMDISGDTATPSDVLAGATFHDRSGASQVGTLSLDEFATIDLLKDTVGWTGKNELQIPSSVVTKTENGVTFTVTKNSDGQVTEIDVDTAGSAASGNASLELLSGVGSDISAFNGDILSGCTGGANSSYFMEFVLKTSPYTQYVQLKSGEAEISDIPSDSSSIALRIYVKSGQTLSHVKFYPMIRKASISDSTFEPYHESVKEVLRDGEVIEGKNLLPYPIGTKQVVASDGTISDNASMYLSDYIEIDGKHITACADAVNGEASLRIAYYTAAKVFISRLNYNVLPWTPQTNVPANAKYVRICFEDDNINYLTNPMIVFADETDTTFEPYYIPLKDSKFNRSEQRVLGAKNLLKYPYGDTTKTHNGITFTDMGDGTVNVNGTASDEASFYFCYRADGSKLSDIVNSVNSILSGGVSNNVFIQFDFYNGTTYISALQCKASEVLVTVPANTTNISASLRVASGTAISTPITINPMLRLASDTDDTYVPYAMTNKELTDSLDGWTAASTVSNGSVSFSGLDDTQGWSYHPVFWVDGNSTNLNPTAELSTISGAGTSSMSVTYTTDADNGASCKLRIEK